MASDLHTASPSELKQRLEAERQGEPFLVYRDRDGAQCIFALDGGARFTVGRRPQNDLALWFDPNVSGVHGAFELAGGEWTIVDDGLSRNGSYLNGERVFGHRRLRDGDLIRLGATVTAQPAGDLLKRVAPLEIVLHALAQRQVRGELGGLGSRVRFQARAWAVVARSRPPDRHCGATRG